MTLAVVVLSGFVAAAASPLIVRMGGRAGARALALVPVAAFVYFLSLAPEIRDGEVIAAGWDWAPAIGVRLSFAVDGLALAFLLLISGIGALVVVYAADYLGGDARLGRFMLALLAFMASMVGVVAADNVFALFVFWELTSVTSYLLIGFDHERETSRKAALQALLVTGAGGLALLAGLVLLALVTGETELSAMSAAGGAIRGDDLYLAILLLVLAGAATKSAQFPFHFWLPAAMEAPTPVSAYLHSATMVKAGVYLLARLHPAMGGTDEWHVLVTTFGVVTMLVGAFLALGQFDLKCILAYSTVSVLGLLVMLIGVGEPLAMKAMVAFLVAHALYKAALFLVAGAVDHETHTRDIRELGGLRRSMPLTAGVALVAGASLAGLPPFFAFIAKETVLESALETGLAGGWLLAGSLVVMSALMVFVAGTVCVGPFFGRREGDGHVHEAPIGMWAPPLVLASLGLVLGLAPWLIEDWLVRTAVEAALGSTLKAELALWHGVNAPLGLSAVAIAGGAALYLAKGSVRAGTSAIAEAAGRAGPARGYDAALAGLAGTADAQTRVLQNGYLRFYLIAILSAFVGLFWVGVAANGMPEIRVDLAGVAFYEWVVVALTVAGALLAVLFTSRLAAVAALGLVGFGIAAIFAFYGALDVAMTQILVEALTVILFVLVFYHLKATLRPPSWPQVARDAVVAGLVGVVMTSLVLAATTNQLAPPISDFYAANSLPAAFGRNVVNVILVDFRALDTLGEIVVLAVAALGSYAMLRLQSRKDDAP